MAAVNTKWWRPMGGVGFGEFVWVKYQNGSRDINRHVAEEDKNTVVISDGNRGNPNQTVINESGLYALIFGSKLDSAKRFKHWVTSEMRH